MVQEIKSKAISPDLIKVLSHPAMLWLGCYLALILLNAGYLCNPPHWDEILGLHNQAVWLKNHHFNLVRLWDNGGYFLNGSNIYPFSLYPLLYALLYRLFEPQTVHFIGHLIAPAAISGMLVLSYLLIRRFSGSLIPALLLPVAGLCEPIIAGRATELGFESVIAFLAMLVVYFISVMRFRTALAIIALTFFVKPTGILLILAFGVLLIILLCVERPLPATLRSRWLWTSYIVLLVGAVLMYKMMNDMNKGFLSASAGITANFYHFWMMFPVIGLMLLIFLTSGIVALLVLALKTCRDFRRPLNDEARTLLFLMIFILGFWTAYAIFAVSLPRYTAMVIFPMLTVIGMTIRSRWLSGSAAIVLAVAGLCYWNDRFLPPLPAGVSRSGELLERNRTFLDDVEMNQVLCRFIETNYYDTPIVAKPPFLQMLTIPEMGYVKSALPKVISGVKYPPKYCPLLPYSPEHILPDTLFLYAQNSLDYVSDDCLLNPFREDQIIFVSGKMPAVNVLYRKSPARRLMTVGEFRKSMMERAAQNKK